MIESHIDGAFTGWSGGALFKLRNGQLWQQEGFSYRYRYAYMPRVAISVVGDRHLLRVEGMGEGVFVRRLR